MSSQLGFLCGGTPAQSVEDGLVGSEDNLLQSRNGKNSIPKGKFSGPRPNSTKAIMLKLPVEEAVSDMTVSTWACQSKLEGAERVTRTTESRSAIPETIITSVVLFRLHLFSRSTAYHLVHEQV